MRWHSEEPKMTGQLFASQFRTYWRQISFAFAVVVYFIINVFRIGGDAFLIYLNDNLAIPLAICVTLLALILWRRIAVQSQNRLLWSGLTIGWALWTIAEFWWGIAAMLGQEVPYPSWADFFWLAGYIPMSIALWERIRSLPRKIGPWQSAGIWISILISLGWTLVFVLIPIIRNNDPTAVLESVLNILYPLVDLVLLIMVLRILFAYQQGVYGHAWGWFSMGFALHSFSNLFFSYATTADIYDPGGQVNLLSNIVTDVPYNLGYLFWLIGLLVVRDVQRSHRAFADTNADMTPALVPDTHIFVSTKGDNTVIDVSQNYSQVFSLERVKGKTISEALGISLDVTDSLLTDIKTNRILKEKPLPVTTRWGQQQAWISGALADNSQEQYSGVDLLLRMHTGDHNLDGMSTDHHGVMNSLLSITGTKEKEDEEIKELLSNYYLAYLKAFYNCIFSEGGSIMADAFLTELQSVAKQHRWQIGIHPDALLDVSALSLSKTQEALPAMFETAKRFVSNITDEVTADSIVQTVRSRFDKSIPISVSHFERAK